MNPKKRGNADQIHLPSFSAKFQQF
jgi:hypothetical protein